MRRAAAATLVLFLFAFYANAEEMRGRMGRSSIEVPQASPPPLRAASLAAAPRVATLERTLDADVTAMRAWNDSGQVPSRIGIIRELKESVAVRVIAMASNKPWQWRGTVHVDGATRTRLRLRDVTLPASAKLWVYGEGEAISFTPASTYEGVLWTPSVIGSAITLEVESTSGTFTIASVADLRDEIVANGTECFQSAACQSQAMRDAGRAIARYEVPASPGFVTLCSGGLINSDSTPELEPYFLTANHCLSTQAEAAGTEVFWDYRPSSCGGVPPSLGSVPRTNGATLLVTSANTDVTLLRLSSAPGQRFYLGWNTRALAFGEELRRVSHPNGNPQVFSTTTVNVDENECAAIPRGRFIYSERLVGGVSSGSSGAPVFIEDGIIVGQLFGKCGTKLSDDCSALNYSVDGALRESYPLLQPFLRPQVSSCGACTPNNNTACMLGNRFKVTMPAWRDTFSNLSGQGSLVKYAENLPEIHPQFGPVSESAFFSMYTHAPKSIEALVRIIKGQNINDKYWVFLMGFTGAEYTINIQDTQTCRTWQRTVPVGATSIVKDFEAFPFN
ncbi:MAG TPA: trypsin-like peptidase domain-containing protein [Thermoanaerobaculia bacterium]|jgi:hypothetical protein|nr:trypsin-like peptidase domain-containing protein [Thermoanaerobaculia bacterium]